jgi:hypothetical protein
MDGLGARAERAEAREDGLDTERETTGGEVSEFDIDIHSGF